jgi:AraC-like DNA-binding protein
MPVDANVTDTLPGVPVRQAVFEPAPALRDCVLGAWDVAALDVANPGELSVQALPEPGVALCFQFGDPLLIERDGCTSSFRTHVSGVQNRMLRFSAAGATRSLVVKLAPHLAGRVLGRPIAEFADGHVDLRELFGMRRVEALEDELAHAHDAPQRFALAQRFIGERLAATACAGDPLMDRALARIVQGGGRERISDLAAGIGLGERQFARRFQAHVGLRPKALARIARLQAALRARGGGAAWVDAALDAGYADQSHWSREFRQAAGAAPQAFFRERDTNQRCWNDELGTSVFFNTRFV